MQDEAPAVFLDDAKVEPTLAVDELSATDVVHVLAAVVAMVGAFVVESDLRLVVAHVDERLVESIADPDLRSRSGQAIVDEEQTQACFARRLCATIHECQRHPRTPDTACTAVSLRQGDYFIECHSGRGGQSVQVLYRDIAWQVPGDVQRCAHRSRHG